MSNRAIALATLVAVLITAVRFGQAVDCGQVYATIFPCRDYLRGSGGETPPRECCDAVRGLVSMTPSQQDRQTACQCLKDAAARNPGIDTEVAANLPGRCGVTTTIPINPNVNCQGIS